MPVNQQERLAYLIETMWKEQYGDKPLDFPHTCLLYTSPSPRDRG